VVDPLLKPRPALAGLLVAGRHGRPDGPPGVTLREHTHLALASVMARRGEAEALDALVRNAYGFDLPQTPRLAGGSMPDGRSMSFIWAGPRQWLVAAEGIAELERELVAALGRRAVIADQSDGRCLIGMSGSFARHVLAKGAAIDLDPRVFKPGDVAITQAAHVNMHLWQLDDRPSYEISVFRSLAASFWSWLCASAAEFGYEVVAEG